MVMVDGENVKMTRSQTSVVDVSSLFLYHQLFFYTKSNTRI